VVTFAKGAHRVEAPWEVAVVWLGPLAATAPALPPGDHLKLFNNWY
jgi:hypothetical protein